MNYESCLLALEGRYFLSWVLKGLGMESWFITGYCSDLTKCRGKSSHCMWFSHRTRRVSGFIKFNLATQSCPTLYDPMDSSMPGFPVYHQLPELTQTHVHWVSDAIQPSHPLSSPFLPAFNLSQHQGLFKWVSSSHQVAKILEFQLQHQSRQWTLRTDFL